MCGREGVVSRVIRESEDLPELKAIPMPPWKEAAEGIMRIKKGYPRIEFISIRGFFIFNRELTQINANESGLFKSVRIDRKS